MVSHRYRSQSGTWVPNLDSQKHNVLPIGTPVFTSDRSSRFISWFKPFGFIGQLTSPL
jgi:hypothetical protein